jgi:hypothetical protein
MHEPHRLNGERICLMHEPRRLSHERIWLAHEPRRLDHQANPLPQGLAPMGRSYG